MRSFGGFLSASAASLPIVLGCGGNTVSTIDDAGVAATTTSAAGTFTVSGGTFAKLSLTPLSSAAYLTPAQGNGVRTRLRVIVADRPALCSKGSVRQNETVFFIDALSDASPFAPGTYTQKNDAVPFQVDVGMSKLDATCLAAGRDYGAVSATVVVSEISETAVKGTYDLTFPDDDGTLQGTFNVSICAGDLDAACNP